MIDINNYEEYVMDYLEGTLSGDAYQEMTSFLNLNPSIKEDISDLLDFSLPADDVLIYDDKKGLQKRNRYGYGVVGLLLGVMLIGYFLYQGDSTEHNIPNNKIEKYQMPIQKQGNINTDIEYVENKNGDTQKALNVDDNNADLAIASKSTTNQQKISKSSKVKVSFKKAEPVKYVEVVSALTDVNVTGLNAINESEETLAIASYNNKSRKDNIPLRRKETFEKVGTMSLMIKTNEIATINIDDFLKRDELKVDDNKKIEINVKLGRFAKTKNKIKSFLETETLVAVRDAITPEYFAKN